MCSPSWDFRPRGPRHGDWFFWHRNFGHLECRGFGLGLNRSLRFFVEKLNRCHNSHIRQRFNLIGGHRTITGSSGLVSDRNRSICFWGKEFLPAIAHYLG